MVEIEIKNRDAEKIFNIYVVLHNIDETKLYNRWLNNAYKHNMTIEAYILQYVDLPANFMNIVKKESKTKI